MGSLPRFDDPKDPGSRLDYQFDFTALLESAEQITSITVTVDPTGLTVDAESILAGGKVVLLILSGGTACTTYTITVRAETDSGGPPTRIFERSCLLEVEDR